MVQLRQPFDEVLVHVKQPTGQAFFEGTQGKERKKNHCTANEKKKEGTKEHTGADSRGIEGQSLTGQCATSKIIHNPKTSGVACGALSTVAPITILAAWITT